ncbi:MAG: hypothetical protein GOMPHAMPRED_004774 [Gomphillus americanus]|uniref:Uncharacterized protein n=1 Tax=Gomphillus americanus TaxID=1940652 RepID=A0A8H3EJ41_9LECA|nr:MAG: hypothetical protein GOMPHAMPRED_004774 [Gomphillus americanus]
MSDEKRELPRFSPARTPAFSPTRSAFRNRVPKQIRRALPVYLICIVVFLFITNVGSLGGIRMPTISRREPSNFVKQKPLQYGTYFPKKIWQSWKQDPLNFEERDLNTARTWIAKNPHYRYEVLTDNNDIAYLEQFYGHGTAINRPDIVEFYQKINATIIRADMLRYLIMYAEGGIYADIDVEALRPIERFIPERYDEKDIQMVVSVEVDEPEFNDHPILGKKSQSFCQWTFMSKPRHPVMLKLVDGIMKWLKEISHQQRCHISEVVLDFDQVIEGTGPSAFTAAILEYMSKKVGKKVTWHNFHQLYESKLEAGILVLSVEAFAAGQGHSDSGNHNARGALVKHHYHASLWPSKHPRFNHPVYGEVEKCNWDPACVKRWDDDIAAWGSLSTEEQQAKINDKQTLDNLMLPLPLAIGV